MLESKTIVRTAVASGIGAETSAELKRQGATVIGIDGRAASSHTLTHMHGIES